MEKKEVRSESDAKDVVKEITVPVIWRNLDDIPTVYANEFIITHAGREFFLIFGEMLLLPLDGKEPPEEVNVKPILKVAITRENMLRIHNAIEINMEKFIKRQEQRE